MQTGHPTPGHEIEGGAPSTAATLAAAATEPLAWTPPVPQAPPQPTSFNPRAGVTQPASIPPVAQHSPAPHMAPQAYPAHAPQPYAPDFAQPQPAQADYYPQVEYGAPDFSPAPPPSFASMGHPQAAPQEPWGPPPNQVHPSAYAAPSPYEVQDFPEEDVTKPSLLSRFKRKPKGDGNASGGIMTPASHPVGVVGEMDAPKTSSSKAPFLMGVLTGIAMMLGVGFLLGGEPEPIPARYAPSPTADATAPADAPLAFVDVE